MLRRAEYWAWRLGGRPSLPLSLPLAPKGEREDRRLNMPAGSQMCGGACVPEACLCVLGWGCVRQQWGEVV